MRDTRNSEGVIRDENILAGSGCIHFIGGMRDSFEIVGRMRDLNSKSPFENLTRRGWDKDSESGEMKPKLGFKKPILEPSECVRMVRCN